MSIAINLLYNPTAIDHLDKDFVGITALTGELKENTSVIDPIVTIQTTEDYMFGYTDNENTYHHGCNYFSIPKFNRYYFLTDVIVLETGLYEIHGHVDVLGSFKTSIREQTAIVKRQANDNAYNLYINDNSLKAYQDPYVITKTFPRGFEGFRYILAIAGVKGATEVHDPPAIADLTVSVAPATIGYTYTLNWSLQSNTEWYDVYTRYYSQRTGYSDWVKRNTSKITTNTFALTAYPALSGHEFAVVSNNEYGTNWSNIVPAPDPNV